MSTSFGGRSFLVSSSLVLITYGDWKTSLQLQDGRENVKERLPCSLPNNPPPQAFCPCTPLMSVKKERAKSVEF